MSQTNTGSTGPDADQRFPVTDLGNIEWWARQFTETHNCAPGGVFLILGGPVRLSFAAAAWYITALGIQIVETHLPFSKIIHIVPPKSRLRDEQREICTSVKSALVAQGQSPHLQDASAEECASRCILTSDGDEIVNHLASIPEFTAVAISCAERVRFSALEIKQANVVTTHTGLHLNFALEDQLILPHLWKLLENLLRLSAERKLTVVVLAEVFGPVVDPIPQHILESKDFAYMQARRDESDTSNFSHFLAADEICKTAGADAARTYLEKHVLGKDECALAVAALLARAELFSAAWEALVPHLSSICERAPGRVLLNVAQAAAAAGARVARLMRMSNRATAPLRDFYPRDF